MPRCLATPDRTEDSTWQCLAPSRPSTNISQMSQSLPTPLNSPACSLTYPLSLAPSDGLLWAGAENMLDSTLSGPPFSPYSVCMWFASPFPGDSASFPIQYTSQAHRAGPQKGPLPAV